MQKVFQVEGMMCGNCEARLTRVLKAVEGVEAVIASHKDGSCSVDFDEAKVSVSALAEAIEDAGFDVK